MNYKEAGVNLELGDKASKILFDAAKETFKNREGNIGEVVVPFDDFSGLRMINVGELPKDSFMCMGFDGVGTKIEIAQRMDNHSTIAYDLFAMVCDDAIVRGGEPVLIGSVLDVNTLGDDPELKWMQELAKGYVAAAKEANVAVINGELAELGHAVGGYGEYQYNWCSGLVWFARKDKLFTGDEVQLGDSLVAFEEKGFRSNGLSLARKVFETYFGEEWHTHKYNGVQLGELVLEPSTIYSRPIVNMHGGFNTEGTCKLHAVSHITGGGVPGKLGRVLKSSGFGADLTDLFDPCEAMQYCQAIGKISDREVYRTWNMGQGLIVATPEPEKVIAEAAKYGLKAKIAGKVTSEKGIRIKSKGINQEDLIFD